MTADDLLDNSSHMNWLTPSQKLLVSAMMDAYKDLALENITDTNINTVNAFVNHCEKQGLEITDSAVESFFDA